MSLLGLFATSVAPAAPAPPDQEPGTPWVARRWTTEHGLPQSSVTSLLRSREGYLWIGTFGGLARFDGLRFTVFDSAQGLAASRILALAEDSEGALWIGTEDSGLWRRSGDRFAPWPGGGFEETGVIWTVATRADAVWLGTFQGVLRMPRDGGAARRFGVESGLPERWVRSLAVDPQGRLWARTGSGTAVLEGERFVARDAPESIWGLPADQLPSLSEVAGLPAGTVIRAALADPEGSLWLGTDSGGLVRLRRAQVEMLGAAEGLPEGSVLPILEDRDGTVWVGGWCSGLFRQSGRRFELVPRPDGGTFGCVSALYEDRAGALWIGAVDTLWRYQDGKAARAAAAGALPGGRVNALAEDQAGTLWVGTSGGLAALERGAVTVYGKAEGLPHENVRSLFAAPDGSLWVGTQGGVARRGSDGRFEILSAAGAPAEPVRDFLADEDGSLWLATYGGGLVRYREGRFERVTTAQGLPDSFISRMLPDDAGHLWLCGNRGIYRVDRQALAEVAAGARPALLPLPFGTAEGLRVAECHGGGQPAGWRSRDGRLWFPTVGGVAMIDPGRLDPPLPPPPVVIEAVAIDGRLVPQQVHPTRPSIEVPAGASHVEIDFTALSFVRSEEIRFRYRLRGFEPHWQGSGTRRTAFYTRVPPGEYRFQVTAANRDGVWNEQGAELALDFRPRLRQTIWFQSVLVALLVAAPLLLYRVRTTRLRARQRLLAAGIARATAELAAAHRRAEAQVVELGSKEAQLASLNRELEGRVAEQTLELRETRDVAVVTLAKLAELRDGATGQHLERIAEFSRRLAELLRVRSRPTLPLEFVDQLFRSSPLHDIGKVAIPDAILRKPGRLTAEERAIIESHTTIGGDTLRSVIERYDSHSFLVMGMDIAYSHHERWDGTGYPRRLAGEAIPLAARIVGLVDAYDAITSQRPYKPRLSHEEALRRITVDRGLHFDPELVELFLSIEGEFAELSATLQAPDA